MKWLQFFKNFFDWVALLNWHLHEAESVPPPEPKPVLVPITVPLPQPSEPMPDPLTALLPWTTQKNYYHNVGVLCDRTGLTFAQKDIVRRCIYVESRFRDYFADGTPVRGFNKEKNGNVWSTDWGLVQINDWPKFKHIGPGCMFYSVEDVLTHPQRSAQFMIDTMKRTGKLQPWASYTSGAYKDVPTSALLALKS